MTRTKVVHIITKLELGGAQEITLFTVRNLPKDRYDLTLVSGSEGLLSPEARSIPGVEFKEVPELVREVSPLKDIIAFFKLYSIIREKVTSSPAYVLVHTHSSKAGILGRWAAWLAGARPIVHSIHGYGFHDYQKKIVRTAYIFLEKLTARVTDGYTADSQANIDKGKSMGLFRRAAARVVRCAIPVEFYAGHDPEAKLAHLGIPESAPVAVMVSCLKPQKAPEDFVRAAAKVLERVPDAHFIQAGDGELRDFVLAEARRLKIDDRYHLLGWRRDVRDIIHLSDVLVLTSLWEGLPRVIPQAMAAGKPVVCTAVDGSPEAVKDGVNGFLARPRDVDYIAEKVSLLLSDKALATKMGEAGRAMVGEFDEARMLGDLDALYDSLLKEAA